MNIVIPEVMEFRCLKCGGFSPSEAAEFEGVCPNCESVLERYDRPACWGSIAVYRINRTYGGPEEGGWWYDEGTIMPETLRCYDSSDFPQVAEYESLLFIRYPNSRDERFRVYAFAEYIAPTGFPKSKPEYR